MGTNLKVAAITGACGGLGRALSHALAEQGYSLVVGGRSQAALSGLTQDLSAFTKVEGIVLDIRKSSECKKFISAAEEKFGRLDVLINNAGILKMEDIEDVEENNLKDIFDTNVFGTIFCTRAAAKIMKKQGSGCIVNIASRAAVDRYPPMLSVYTASKAAVIGFSGCLKNELAHDNIDVFAVSPYFITSTRLYRSVDSHTKADGKQKLVLNAVLHPESVAEKILERIENPKGEWHVILGGNLN